MDTIEFLKIEESYQYFRLLMNQIDPGDQRERCLDFVKGLSRLTKKQIKVFSDFTDRYRQTEYLDTHEEPIYSVLIRLANEDEINIERRYIEKKTKKGERFVSYATTNPRTITLDLSLSNEDLIWHLAWQMGALQLLSTGDYGDMTRNKSKTKDENFRKLANAYATTLINGIELALWA